MKKALTPEEAQALEPNEARRAALQYSQLLATYTAIIEKLEKRVAELSHQLGAQNQQVLFTQEVLNNLKRKLFGRSSERRTPGDDGPLFALGVDPKDPEYETIKRKKRTKFGRKEQPALPVVEIVHELPADEVNKQGLTKWEGQYEESRMVSVVPTRLVMEVHKQQKYIDEAAKTGEKPDAPCIVTAPGPLKLRAGSGYSIEFGVEVGLGKYLYHMPLERQVRQMSDQGLDVDNQTLYGQTKAISDLFKQHVIPGITAMIKSSRVNMADETWWWNLGKRDEAKKQKFYLWAVRNPKAVLFSIYDSRSEKAARDFLGDLKGVLLSDGYGVYRNLASRSLIWANDWYHVRRKFVEAEKNYPVEAKFFTDCIRALSRVESKIKGKPPDEVLCVRQTMSKPIVESMGEKLEVLSNHLPESSLGKAVHYTRKLWKGLQVFLGDPEVPMSTNAIEGVIRGPAVGRKNHYGSKTLASAEVAANWYSVIETCKIYDVSPREYIDGTIRAILNHEPVKMPWEWKATRSQVSREPTPSPADSVSKTVVCETPMQQ